MNTNFKKKQYCSLCMLLLSFFIFSDKPALAQTVSSESKSMNYLFNAWVLGGFALMLVGFFIYVLRASCAVLHENGKKIEFIFPAFKDMAHNKKTVTTIIVMIAIAGLLCAINYKE